MRPGQTGWRSSVRSGQSGDNCVEVALAGESVALRDSADRFGPVLVFDPARWRAFLTEAKDGGFRPRLTGRAAYASAMEHPKGAFDASRAVWRRAADDNTLSGHGTGGPGGHIEVAFVDALIGVRSSADPDGPILVFTEGEWDAFVGGAKDGEFDV